MKKIFLLAFLAASTSAVRAQSIAAGTISLGGSIGYSRSTDKEGATLGNTNYTSETTSSRFSFSPAAGYFIADNLALGLNLGYNAVREGYTTITPTPALVRAELDPQTTLQVGPYVQYYKMISEQFGVLGTLGGGYQRLRSQSYSGSGNNLVVVDNKASGYYANLTPGVIFFPVPKFGISASIGSLSYDRLNFDFPESRGNTAPDDYENTTSNFGAGFGLDQLQFGGTYYFGR
jgi:hypothetical protein